jgi:hypothetical protein
MRDTPETKAFKTRIRGIDGDKHWVPAGFAEILERERDEAKAELSLKCQSVTIASGTISDLLKKSERLERERDEAIRQRNETNESSKYAVDYAIRERDEATQQLRIAVGLLSTQPQFANKHPEDVLAFVKEGAK